MQRDHSSTQGTDGTGDGGARRRRTARRVGGAAAVLLATGGIAALAGQQGAVAAPTPAGISQTMTVTAGGTTVPGDSGATFDVTGWSWTIKPLATTRTVERITLSVTHVVGDGSPQLMTAYGRQTALTVRIVLTRPSPKAGTQPGQTYVFGSCRIGQLKHGSSTSAEPTDTVTLGCTRVQLESVSLRPDGTLGPAVRSVLDAGSMPAVP